MPLGADQIAKLAERVRSPYRLGRRWAARLLARDAAPEAVWALAEATTHGTEDGVIAFARAALAKRTDQPAIDAICRVWRDTRNYELGELISRRGWSAAEPPALRALIALHTSRLEPLAFETREAARALVEVADTEEPPIGTRAAEALTSLHRTAAREAVCQLAIEGGSPAALAAVLAGEFVPAEPAHRALLLLLAGDYDRYAELDFDGSLLRAALAVAHQNVRTRLARQAREAGRLEWVRAVASTGRPARLAMLTYGEWETAAAILRRTGQPEEVWQLALQAPPVLSARILRAHEPEWLLSAAGTDREYAARLLELTQRCPDVVPTGVVFDEGPTIKGDRFRGLKFALSQDGELIATTDLDGARLWRADSGERIGLLPNRAIIGSLAFVEGAAQLAIAYGRGDVQILEVPSGGLVAGLHPGHVRAMTVSADSRLLATVSQDRVFLRQLPELEEIWSGSTPAYPLLAMTPDGSTLATAGRGGRIEVWRPSSGEPPQVLDGPGGELFDLVLAPDGSEVICVGGFTGGPTGWRYSLPAGTPLGPLPNSFHLRSLAVSPDGGLLLGGRSGQEPVPAVRLWRLPSGEYVDELGTGRALSGIFSRVAVSPDGSLIAARDWSSMRSWRPVLATLAKTPVARIDRADVDRVRAAAGLSTGERAWIELITVLKGWRHRHDIELSGGTGPDETDIELGPEVL